MSRIILEVDDSIARKWEASSKQLKKKVTELIAKFVSDDAVEPTNADAGYALSDKKVQKAFEKNRSGIAAYQKLLNEIGNTAAKSGLTEQKLETLLLEEND